MAMDQPSPGIVLLAWGMTMDHLEAKHLVRRLGA